MNTSEINASLKDCKSFKGTFSCDRIPSPKNFPSSFIINTDPAKEPGEHWVSIAFSANKDIFYFDSFGFPPLVPQLRAYIQTHCKRGFVYNSQTLQHPNSQSCGLFCVDFIRTLDAGKSYEQFISQCSRILRNNESKIQHLYKHSKWAQ